ncbi:MAG: 3-deoxy-7-phosphoheptulonate synthase [Peptostreptococcales bacterium]
MMLVIKEGIPQEEIERIKTKLIKEYSVDIHESIGKNYHLLGLVGDTASIDPSVIQSIDIVDNLIIIQEPYKKANRKFHPTDTVVDILGQKIGHDTFTVIAGPCSIEGNEDYLSISEKVKASGAHILRGGAFKPRTSPYSFQGMGEEGIEIMKEARKKTGLPIVSELMSIDKIDFFVENVDIIQIGARNMQNYNLLQEVGKTNKPILLKRGLSATIEEFLMSAEYIMAKGNENVILCERGIRTFEKYTRNTLDISAVPVIKKHSHLPIIIDPSHAGGKWWLVEPLAKAAMAVGADGIMIEVHNDPQKALCDGDQSIKPERFDDLMSTLKNMSVLLDKKMQ